MALLIYLFIFIIIFIYSFIIMCCTRFFFLLNLPLNCHKLLLSYNESVRIILSLIFAEKSQYP